MIDWKMARRDLLKRLGLGMAWLPLLNATRASAAAPAPTRLFAILAIQGYRLESWLPPVGPLSGTLPPGAAPLAAHQQDLIFLPGLTDQSYPTNRKGYGAYSTIFYGLPDVSGTGEYRQPKGPTVDQFIGGALPLAGRPTLPLAVQVDLPPTTLPLEARRCCWLKAGEPINPLTDPMAAFQDLFGAAPVTTDVRHALAERKIVLDYVGDGLTRFGQRLGTDDRALLDSHLQAIRSLEAELSSSTTGVACQTPPADDPPLDITKRDAYGSILNLQMQVAVAAFRCGSARVATLQLSDAEGAFVDFGAFVPGIPSMGTLPTTWKSLGQGTGTTLMDRKRLVDEWWMSRLATLIEQMKAVPDLDGKSLFDNATILWANTIDDGLNRNPQKLPWLLAGSCGGYFKTGQCAASAGKPSSAVLGALCEAMGLAMHPFGSSLPLHA